MSHKGIVCPSCGFAGKEEDEIISHAAFLYLEDVQIWRAVRGFNAKGDLEIESRYETGEGFDDGTNPRIMCGKCLHEFSIPDDINNIEWVSHAK